MTDEAEVSIRPGRRRHLRLLGRASWNMLDQVLSALTNAVLFFVVARLVSRAGLDAFSTAFYVFSLLIGIERALVGQVFGIRFSDPAGRTSATWRAAAARGLGLALAVTTAASIVMIAVGLVLRGALRETLIATAVVLPALVLQDACRMAFFAQARAHLAALNDALWAVVQFVAIAVLIATGTATAPTLVLAWGGAAAVCVVVALVQLRVRPRPSAALAWFRETRGLSGFLLGEYLLGAGAFNGGFLVVGGIVGEGALGAIRGAQVLLGPLGVLASGLVTFALPELSRRTWLTASTRWRVAAATASLMTVTALAYTALLLLLPTAAGTFLLDDKWAGARAVLLPVALGSTAAGACLGPSVVIYAMGRARATFRLMVIEAPLVFVLMITGAVTHGVVGAAWGLAADQSLLVPLWFLQLRSILRRADGPAEAAGADPDQVSSA